MSFAGGALKGFENLKRFGDIGRKGAIGAKNTIKPPLSAAAKNKMVQRAAFPALAGGGIGIGSYAALTGAGEGFRSFSPKSTSEGAQMGVSIVAVLGILFVLVVLYTRFMKAGK